MEELKGFMELQIIQKIIFAKDSLICYRTLPDWLKKKCLYGVNNLTDSHYFMVKLRPGILMSNHRDTEGLKWIGNYMKML